MEEIDISIYSDETELANTAVADLLSVVNEKLKEKSECHISLTGGSLGNLISTKLADHLNKGDWEGLNIWWSDERFVPLTSLDRNDLQFVNSIKEFSKVRVQRAPFDGDVTYSAELFAKEATKIDFDLMILGMGPDGHVASLFPNNIHEDEKRAAFAITDSPKPPKERITLSLRKINESNEIWLVASGEAKAEAIASLMEEDLSLPVSHVNLTRLMLDSAAFGVGE
jgi:6-phosphogluconolactonase